MASEEHCARIAEGVASVSMENQKEIASIALQGSTANTALGGHSALIAEGVASVSMESAEPIVRFAEVGQLASTVARIFARFVAGIEFVNMVNSSITA